MQRNLTQRHLTDDNIAASHSTSFFLRADRMIDDPIPCYAKSGRRYTEVERSAIAKRLGLCVSCHAVQTHTPKLGGVFPVRRPITNGDVYNGICIRCNCSRTDCLPKDVLDAWELRNRHLLRKQYSSHYRGRRSTRSTKSRTLPRAGAESLSCIETLANTSCSSISTNNSWRSNSNRTNASAATTNEIVVVPETRAVFDDNGFSDSGVDTTNGTDVEAGNELSSRTALESHIEALSLCTPPTLRRDSNYLPPKDSKKRLFDYPIPLVCGEMEDG